MNPPRVLLINQSYTPDRGASGRLLGELFPVMCETGMKATVVAGPPTYTDEEIPWVRREKSGGLTVLRVGSARFKGRRSLFKRVAAYVSFLGSALVHASSLARTGEFDVVTTASNPPFVGLIGAWCSATSGLPFVYMLHDLHPDMAIKTGRFPIPGPVRALWNSLNNIMFSRAKTIVVLGESMKDYLQEVKGVPPDKVRAIHPWAVPEVNSGAKANSYRIESGAGPERLIVLYFGNITSTHSLNELVAAAEALRNRPVQFHFVGDGPDRDSLEARCRQAGLLNVRFLPYQSGDRFLQILSAADISVTSLTPGLEGLAVPSKTYAIMASGRPVLALCDDTSEVASIVHAAGCGWVADSSERIARVITQALDDRASLESMGERARAWYDAHFSRDRAVRQYLEVFAEASGDSAKRASHT